jgi:copper chaperone
MLLLKVSGMTCGHCVAAVTRAVQAVASVERVTVSLERGEVEVEGHPDERAVRAAIAEEGYEVQAVPSDVLRRG